jgi:hypothetical protein
MVFLSAQQIVLLKQTLDFGEFLVVGEVELVVVLLSEGGRTQKMKRSLDLEESLSMSSWTGSSMVHLTLIAR